MLVQNNRVLVVCSKKMNTLIKDSSNNFTFSSINSSSFSNKIGKAFKRRMVNLMEGIFKIIKALIFKAKLTKIRSRLKGLNIPKIRIFENKNEFYIFFFLNFIYIF